MEPLPRQASRSRESDAYTDFVIEWHRVEKALRAAISATRRPEARQRLSATLARLHEVGRHNELLTTGQSGTLRYHHRIAEGPLTPYPTNDLEPGAERLITLGTRGLAQRMADGTMWFAVPTWYLERQTLRQARSWRASYAGDLQWFRSDAIGIEQIANLSNTCNARRLARHGEAHALAAANRLHHLRNTRYAGHDPNGVLERLHEVRAIAHVWNRLVAEVLRSAVADALRAIGEPSLHAATVLSPTRHGEPRRIQFALRYPEIAVLKLDNPMWWHDVDANKPLEELLQGAHVPTVAPRNAQSNARARARTAEVVSGQRAARNVLTRGNQGRARACTLQAHCAAALRERNPEGFAATLGHRPEALEHALGVIAELALTVDTPPSMRSFSREHPLTHTARTLAQRALRLDRGELPHVASRAAAAEAMVAELNHPASPWYWPTDERANARSPLSLDTLALASGYHRTPLPEHDPQRLRDLNDALLSAVTHLLEPQLHEATVWAWHQPILESDGHYRPRTELITANGAARLARLWCDLLFAPAPIRDAIARHYPRSAALAGRLRATPPKWSDLVRWTERWHFAPRLRRLATLDHDQGTALATPLLALHQAEPARTALREQHMTRIANRAALDQLAREQGHCVDSYLVTLRTGRLHAFRLDTATGTSTVTWLETLDERGGEGAPRTLAGSEPYRAHAHRGSDNHAPPQQHIALAEGARAAWNALASQTARRFEETPVEKTLRDNATRERERQRRPEEAADYWRVMGRHCVPDWFAPLGPEGRVFALLQREGPPLWRAHYRAGETLAPTTAYSLTGATRRMRTSARLLAETEAQIC